MNSVFFDPNNHVPEVTQGDDWDDIDETKFPEFSSLPPRKVVENTGVTVMQEIETGLRIESTNSRENSGPVSSKLEIHEITGYAIRLDQEVAPPPKVERVNAFHEKSALSKRSKNPQGESREWGLGKRKSNHWIIAMGLTVMALLVLGIAILPKINAPNAVRAIPQATPIYEDDEEIEGMEVLNVLLARKTEAMKMFRSFVSATQPDEILPLIRHADEWDAELRKNWVPMPLVQSWEPAADVDWTASNLAGTPCGLLAGYLPNRSDDSAYFLIDHGKLVLDWAATTAYGTATFSELNAGTGDGSEIRGILSVADYYTAAYPESGYQSFRLISKNDEAIIWCYQPRQSATYAKLISQFQTSLFTPEAPTSESTTLQKITLRLERGPSDALPNQWLIGELLHFEWLAP